MPRFLERRSPWSLPAKILRLMMSTWSSLAISSEPRSWSIFVGGFAVGTPKSGMGDAIPCAVFRLPGAT
jgi:hypothetical protein